MECVYSVCLQWIVFGDDGDLWREIKFKTSALSSTFMTCFIHLLLISQDSVFLEKILFYPFNMLPLYTSIYNIINP
jgi:hypothetical protein